jgi:hypothetical protein
MDKASVYNCIPPRIPTTLFSFLLNVIAVWICGILAFAAIKQGFRIARSMRLGFQTVSVVQSESSTPVVVARIPIIIFTVPPQ